MRFRITGALLIVGLAGAAAAPAPRISPGDMPGRERQRFVDPPGFREIAPRPPLAIPDSGAKAKKKRKCRVGRKGRRRC